MIFMFFQKEKLLNKLQYFDISCSLYTNVFVLFFFPPSLPQIPHLGFICSVRCLGFGVRAERLPASHGVGCGQQPSSLAHCPATLGAVLVGTSPLVCTGRLNGSLALLGVHGVAILCLRRNSRCSSESCDFCLVHAVVFWSESSATNTGLRWGTLWWQAVHSLQFVQPPSRFLT